MRISVKKSQFLTKIPFYDAQKTYSNFSIVW
jgi:hypothetical protein